MKKSVEEKLDFIASKVEDFHKLNELTLKKSGLEYLLKTRSSTQVEGGKY